MHGFGLAPVPTPSEPIATLTVAQAGGSVDARRLACLEELAGYDLVVNCTGIRGAQQLFNDISMYPIRGQVRCRHERRACMYQEADLCRGFCAPVHTGRPELAP